jgi:putative membrane protein (TIGR04086 family)
MKMLKSVSGVVVGYLLFAVPAALLFWASGRDPHQEQDISFVVFSVVYGMVFAGAGGYVAGAIAGRKPGLHGGAVALIVAVGATASFLAQRGAGSRWSQTTALFLMAPAALVGGVVRSRHKAS